MITSLELGYSLTTGRQIITENERKEPKLLSEGARDEQWFVPQTGKHDLDEKCHW